MGIIEVTEVDVVVGSSDTLMVGTSVISVGYTSSYYRRTIAGWIIEEAEKKGYGELLK